MDILEILKKINVSSQTAAYFEKAFLMVPVHVRKTNTMQITITTPALLPCRIYQEVRKAFSEYLQMRVTLIIRPHRVEYDTNFILPYFTLFSELSGHGEYVNIIPELLPDHICITHSELAGLDEFRKFIRNIGIEDEVILKQPEPEKPIPKPEVRIEKPEVREEMIQEPVATVYEKEGEYVMAPMSALTQPQNNICVTARIYKVEYQTLRSRKTLQRIYMTDYTESLMAKRFENKSLPVEKMHEIEEGQFYKVYGDIKHDDYENRNIIDVHHFQRLYQNPWSDEDDHEGEKHIELHVHTNMSDMDGVCGVDELINQAFRFGHKAIGVCDINNVQAYPKAQDTLIKLEKKNPGTDFKVIFGTEMKMADETLRIVYNPTDQKLGEVEYAVIDLETTGLSTKYDEIIEFGGVIMRNGRIIDRLQQFVKPTHEIPPFIEKKTNISNAMLEYAPSLEECIDKILDFISDRVIVAHNADFDFNFLNDKLVEMGRSPLRNTCLDTLNLAKELITNRKYYRLGLIAKNYGVAYNDEEAHRGDYDAEVLANILVKMLPEVKGYPDVTFRTLQDKQDSDIYKKARTYSVTLLAKDEQGIKDIYEIVSIAHTKELTYFAKENSKKIDKDVVAEPRIIRSEIEKRREHILVGSANLYSELFEMALNRSDEAVEECMKFYDYIEVQPINCYTPVIEQGSLLDEYRLRDIVKNLISTADRLGKKVVATNDVFYTYPYQKMARDVYIMAKRIGQSRHPLYPLNRERRLNFVSPDQHFMTTDELLKCFDYLPEEKAREIVIDNPAYIASLIKKMKPISSELKTPTIEGCEKTLTDVIYKNAHEKYGDPLPALVDERIHKELDSVITNGFSVQYYIAYLLCKKAAEDGYVVGSRGSVGSSFIATMANITEVNPLVPHYVCPKCKHSEFFTNNEYLNGFDLPARKCPVCGKLMERNGHSIPFETFLGFKGDKVPDIDLNFSADYQGRAQQLISDIFGEDYTYRAGTISEVKEKTAYGYVKGYCEEMEKVDRNGKPLLSDGFMEVLALLCTGVKRTTGQHPGGIVVIPKEMDVLDFTPIQYPANNPFSEWVTTHYAFKELHDNVLKLDILGHVDPAAIRLLQIYTGVQFKDITMNDEKALSLFSTTKALKIKDPKGYYTEKTGAAGLPEFGTRNNRRILDKTKPTTFAELVSLSGLTHGTGVWADNAELLVDRGVPLKDVIGCRDDIMTFLISKGVPSSEAFAIMESVRKGRGLTADWIKDLGNYDLPDWYIDSCQRISYMFPKGHAVAYVMMAVRIGWYKIYYPAQHYAVYFTYRCDAYDIETLLRGVDAVYERLSEIREKRAVNARSLSSKEAALENTFEIALEMYLRGYHFNGISLQKSDALFFTVDPDDDHGIIPSFACIDGLGENVANSIVEARNEKPFLSKQDFQNRTQVNGTQMAFLEKLGVFEGLTEENQLNFDI